MKRKYNFISRDEWKHLIDQYVFDEKHKRIMLMHIIGVKSNVEIGRIEMYSDAQIGRIIKIYADMLIEKGKELARSKKK